MSDHGKTSSATGLSRRDFAKAMGLSASALAVGCSRAPVEKIVPFLVQPEEITPGVAVWYASTCAACPAACGILLRTRDGRPVKIEGNALHPISGGGVCATGQAAILSLYDASRATGPTAQGKPVTWKELDAAVRDKLKRLAADGRAIRLLVPSQAGPTAEVTIAKFLRTYPTAARVHHDPLGAGAVAEAHRHTHGIGVIPAYRLDRARVLVSFGADFLGTWVAPVAFTRAYTAARAATAAPRLRHVQVEPHLTLTGANADLRIPLAPSELLPALQAVALHCDVRLPLAPPAGAVSPGIEEVAAELVAARGTSLVLAGSDDPAVQALVNAINEALGNYESTVVPSEGVVIPEAMAFEQFLDELRADAVGGVIVVGANPVFTHADGAEIAQRLAAVELSVAVADRPDETASRLQYLAPPHHFLESWGDSEPSRGVLGLSQPAVAPLYDTRHAFESLLVWAGAGRPYYDYLRSRWRNEVFLRAAEPPPTFEAFWDRAVHDGVARCTVERLATGFQPDPVTRLLAERRSTPAGDGLELVLHPSVALRDGALGNNAWLQELPDPITKVTWTNVAGLAPATAARLGVQDGDVVTVEAGGRRLTLPVAIQPGTHPRVVAVDVGRGRTHAGPVGNGVGVNAFPLAGGAGRPALTRSGVALAATGERLPLARSQQHDTMEDRDLVREVDPTAANPAPAAHTAGMWPRHEYPGRRWAMVIDLAACTGCSACVVSCQAENNIPTVGAAEVANKRDLHWLRLDRYYTGPADAPRVVWQPMLCQHCENAPCESVCPVLATVHTREGINTQAYNRCIGTRYCANNCPFKVRRFNWFEYPRNPTERLVLNPDVTVRSRGVMEKCSFCIQRIHEAKRRARIEGRPLADGDVRTACQQSCPAGAIEFGDLNDPSSRVAQLAASGRAYRLLEQLNVEPSVRYLARLRTGGTPA